MENSFDWKSVRLTETVVQGGCAAKLPAGTLRETLSRFQFRRPAELLVGTEKMDDACLWDLGREELLIQTLDFFTPIVDNAYDFGAIAATNALSDVYAMGGDPKIALAILAFPMKTMDVRMLDPIMQGAIDQIHEAGACLAGGHSIQDDSLKFGLSVTGFVAKNRAWANSGVRPGDVLILTKALGTGTITSALKGRLAQSEHVEAAVQSMKKLNQVPKLLNEFEIHAATDITGFGLAGHALQLCRASGVGMNIKLDQLPVLPGALGYLEQKILNRAHKSNLEYVSSSLETDLDLNSPRGWLAMDPQTSGGLLLAVDKKDAPAILERLKARFSDSCVIGEAIGRNQEFSFEKALRFE